MKAGECRMKAILVFIDGTICDDRNRLYLYGTSDFNKVENILNDFAVIGSVECLNELHEQFNIIYIRERSEQVKEVTLKLLIRADFPNGQLYLSEKQEDRLKIAKALSKKYNIVAGIGDRWDDNELHLEIGCMSMILEEYKGNWDTVRKYLLKSLNAMIE
jgi:predicted secreted acid phosphatase